MTPREAAAIYMAGVMRAMEEELKTKARGLDVEALESYLTHPHPDFAYRESIERAIKLAREVKEEDGRKRQHNGPGDPGT